MSTARSTHGCWLAIGCLAIAGCGGSETPRPASGESATPKLTAKEVGDMRARLESSLARDATGRPTGATPPAQIVPLGPPAEVGVQQSAADALAKIGVAAVPTLLEALENKDPTVRARAASALARMGPTASSAVPALTKALSDPDEDVRRNAARALGQMGPAAESAIPALSAVLTQPEQPEGPKSPASKVPAQTKAAAAPGPSPSDR